MARNTSQPAPIVHHSRRMTRFREKGSSTALMRGPKCRSTSPRHLAQQSPAHKANFIPHWKTLQHSFHNALRKSGALGVVDFDIDKNRAAGQRVPNTRCDLVVVVNRNKARAGRLGYP